MLTKLLLQLRRQDGQDLAEYGLVISLIVLASLAALTLLGDKVSALHGGSAVALLRAIGL